MCLALVGHAYRWTADRGNESAVKKLMTMTFPPCAVIMELVCHLERMSATLGVWVVRFLGEPPRRYENTSRVGSKRELFPQNRTRKRGRHSRDKVKGDTFLKQAKQNVIWSSAPSERSGLFS